MMGKQRILFIVSSLGNGGAEKQLTLLLRNLPAYFQVYVFNHSRLENEYWEEEIKGLNHRYERLDKKHSSLWRFFRIGKIIKHQKPDLIICWNVYSAMFVLPYRWINKSIKLAISFRNDAYYLLRSQPLMSLLVPRCDAIISNTQVAIEQMIELGHRLPKSFVLPNAIDPIDKKAEIKPTVTKIGMCGNIHARKGIEVFLQAIAELDLECAPDSIHYWIAGTGDIQSYRKLANRLGIQDSIHFEDHLDGLNENTIQCADIVKKYDVFVLSSHHEGCPNVLLEAMAAGVPSVVTRVGGIPEVASDKYNALVIDPDSPKQLAGAIKNLIYDTTLRHTLSNNAMESMRDRSPKKIAETVFPQIIKSILN